MNISNLQRFRVLPRNSNMAVLVTRKDAETLILQREGEDRKDLINQHDLFVLLGDGWSILNIEELTAQSSAGQVSVGVSLDGVDETLEALEQITEAADKAVAALKAVSLHGVMAAAVSNVAGGALARTGDGKLGAAITSDYVISKEEAAKLAAGNLQNLSEGYKVDDAVNSVPAANYTLHIVSGDLGGFIADGFTMYSNPAKIGANKMVTSPDVQMLDAAMSVHTEANRFTRPSLYDAWACDCSSGRTYTTEEVANTLRGSTAYVAFFPLNDYREYLQAQLKDARVAEEHALHHRRSWHQSYINSGNRAASLQMILAGLGE